MNKDQSKPVSKYDELKSTTITREEIKKALPSDEDIEKMSFLDYPIHPFFEGTKMIKADTNSRYRNVYMKASKEMRQQAIERLSGMILAKKESKSDAVEFAGYINRESWHKYSDTEWKRETWKNFSGTNKDVVVLTTEELYSLFLKERPSAPQS